jgi:hypothetical protein
MAWRCEVIEALVLWVIKYAAADCSLVPAWRHLSDPQRDALRVFWRDNETLVERRLEALGFWHSDTGGFF